MHRRLSARSSLSQYRRGLPAYDHQTGHPNEVSRAATRQNYTANIVLSSMQDSLSHQTT